MGIGNGHIVHDLRCGSEFYGLDSARFTIGATNRIANFELPRRPPLPIGGQEVVFWGGFDGFAVDDQLYSDKKQPWSEFQGCLIDE